MLHRVEMFDTKAVDMDIVTGLRQAALRVQQYVTTRRHMHRPPLRLFDMIREHRGITETPAGRSRSFPTSSRRHRTIYRGARVPCSFRQGWRLPSWNPASRGQHRLERRQFRRGRRRARAKCASLSFAHRLLDQPEISHTRVHFEHHAPLLKPFSAAAAPASCIDCRRSA